MSKNDYDKLNTEDQAWVDEQMAGIALGEDIVNKATDEALDYLQQIMENANDKSWRKMAFNGRAVEVGIGHALTEHVAPFINDTLRKGMRKELKLDKREVESLINIFLGRSMQNIVKALDERKD